MSVKLELYRVFKEVAEVGNITAAAQALYISQSAVSQSIKQLENDLQTRLFSRNSRGVTLTAEGKMLYEYVRSAMGLLETGEEKLSQTRELQMGQLVIGASDTVTSQFLLPYLDGFHREHPAIHIQIISGRSQAPPDGAEPRGSGGPRRDEEVGRSLSRTRLCGAGGQRQGRRGHGEIRRRRAGAAEG